MITPSQPQEEVRRQEQQLLSELRAQRNEWLLAVVIGVVALLFFLIALHLTTRTTCPSGDCCFSTECV